MWPVLWPGQFSTRTRTEIVYTTPDSRADAQPTRPRQALSGSGYPLAGELPGLVIGNAHPGVDPGLPEPSEGFRRPFLGDLRPVAHLTRVLACGRNQLPEYLCHRRPDCAP